MGRSEKNPHRFQDDVYQTTIISKLLLLIENGAASEFKGKPIGEIIIDLNEDLLIQDKENDDEFPRKQPRA